MNLRKWIAALAAAVMLATALAGCGGANNAAPSAQPTADGTAPAKKPVKLTLWSHFTPEEVDALRPVAEEWAKKTGNTVEVVFDQTNYQEFLTASQAGAGPDIMYGLAHNNLGTFQKAGLLAEVPAGVINKDDYEPATLNAVSFDGKMYATPYAIESMALCYNKAKVKDVPKDWDGFVKLATEVGFRIHPTDLYNDHGFIVGMGGYIFKNSGGAYDKNDIGLASPGAIEGYKLIGDLIHKYKFFQPDMNGDMARADFVGGKANLWHCGPWDVNGLKEAKIDAGVTSMPNLPNGKPFVPFTGVQTAFVASASKNQAQAWELVKYLNENAPLTLFKVNRRIPAAKKLRDSAEVKADPYVPAFAAAAANGQPMPNIAALDTVWSPVEQLLQKVTQKRDTPEKAAADAVTQIKELIKAQP